MRVCLLLYFILVSSTLHLYGQPPNIGTPFITNYPKQVYQAATRSGDIAQGPAGILYFANNDGLLSFDGKRWKVHPLPNRTIARSLAIDPLGRIYVGGQDEIGYFAPNHAGHLVFQSLKLLIPEAARSFEDVWDIVLQEEELFFRTSNRIYHLHQDEGKVYAPEGSFEFLGKLQDTIYAQDQRGLLRFESGSWVSVPQGSFFSTNLITALSLGEQDQCLVHTLKNGSFALTQTGVESWGQGTLDFFKTHWITAATHLPNGQIVLGTSQAGVVMLQADGTPLHWIDRQAGLQSNNVLCLFSDQAGSLWLGLSNGIDYVETSSPFSSIYPDGVLKDVGYAINIAQEHIYFGTSNGLYATAWQSYYDPFKPDRYQRIPGTSGQVWGISAVLENLFLGHHEGAFLIRQKAVSKLSDIQGAWKFVEMKAYPGYMIGGTYDGVHLYHQDQGGWRYIRKLDGLNESSRIMQEDSEGSIWVSHPYRGIYRLTFPESPEQMEVAYYNAEKGLPFDNFNTVCHIRNQIQAATAQGVYQYNPSLDQFEPNLILNEVLGADKWVKLLTEDPQGNIWFVVGDEVGLLQIESRGLETLLSRVDFPELQDKLVKGHEFIFPYDARNVLFACERGFIHFDPEHVSHPDSLLHCLINEVSLIAGTDSVIFGGYAALPDLEASSATPASWNFSEAENAFRFSFTATQFSRNGEIEFQYYLAGFEDRWNPWTHSFTKEYTNIPPGEYEFRVRARNRHGIESPTSRFALIIYPPWYASTTAKVIYALLALFVLAAIFWIPRIRFQRETAELKTIMTQEREAQHQQLSHINEERLQEEVRHKNQELASATMHLVQKNEMLSKIRSKLEKIGANAVEPATVDNIQDLIRIIEQGQQIDQDWEQFAFHFDQVHRDFLRRLTETFPQLSPTDHKICAFLRMNLSSKEIAPLMNISVRGVETGRYRLRKKMNLDHDVNLNEFMMRF